MPNQHPKDNLNITPNNKPKEDKQGNWKSEEVLCSRIVQNGYCILFLGWKWIILVPARFEFLTMVRFSIFRRVDKWSTFPWGGGERDATSGPRTE